ncbi:MAG: response regulator [Sphingobacteriaceae bacterium]|nr:MAG: response regulator [Sphingobacteriaceae bacterium]
MEQKNKMMIVDDNPIDQMISAHVLKTNFANREVLIMESAYSALDYLEANKNNPEAMPSIILLDLDMPGMNGFGFLEQFNKFTEVIKNTCRIIVLTGSDVPSDIELMEADPLVSLLLTKPLRKSELIPVI